MLVTSWFPTEKKYGMFAPLVSRSMIGVKLTFHIAAVGPRRTASPDCRTNRTGNGVDESSRVFAIMRSTMRLCSGRTMSPSPGSSGAPRLGVSLNEMNKNLVTAADAPSDASGVGGGSIGLTAVHAVAAGG